MSRRDNNYRDLRRKSEFPEELYKEDKIEKIKDKTSHIINLILGFFSKSEKKATKGISPIFKFSYQKGNRIYKKGSQLNKKTRIKLLVATSSVIFITLAILGTIFSIQTIKNVKAENKIMNKKITFNQTMITNEKTVEEILSEAYKGLEDVPKGIEALKKNQTRPLPYDISKYKAPPGASSNTTPSTTGNNEEMTTLNNASDATLAAMIDRFLLAKGSPLSGLGTPFVEIGRKYGVDPILLVSISGKESTFGKYCSYGYNAWGWGIWGGQGRAFSSWIEGIETVASGLREKYINQGLDTIEKISRKYCPGTWSSWARGVARFYNEILNS